MASITAGLVRLQSHISPRGCICNKILIKIKALINACNCNKCLFWDVITHQCPNFNRGQGKPLLLFGHGWVITSHNAIYMQITYPGLTFINTGLNVPHVVWVWGSNYISPFNIHAIKYRGLTFITTVSNFPWEQNRPHNYNKVIT